MRAGISLADAMLTFAQTERLSPLRTVAEQVAPRLAHGVALSQALAETRYPFPPFVLPMIEVGERSGRLENTFQMLMNHFEQEHQFEQELRWRTFYPKLLSGCSVILLLLILFGTPLIVRIFFGAGFVAGLHQYASGLGRPIVLLITGIFIAWSLWRFLGRLPSLAPAFEVIRISIPWFSALPRNLFAARFARSLAMMVGSGIEPSRSLELAAEASGSFLIRQAARRHAFRLQKGEKFSAVLADLPLIPPMVVHMVTVGETSGTVDEGLTKAAEFLESEAQVSMRTQGVVAGIGLWAIVAILIIIFVISFWARWYGGMFQAVEEFMNAP